MKEKEASSPVGQNSVGEDKQSGSLKSGSCFSGGHICRKTPALRDSKKKAAMRLPMPLRARYRHEIPICMPKRERHGRLQAEKSRGQIHVHELVPRQCEHAKAAKITQVIAENLRHSRMIRRVASEKTWGMSSELWGTDGITHSQRDKKRGAAWEVSNVLLQEQSCGGRGGHRSMVLYGQEKGHQQVEGGRQQEE